MYVEGNPVNMVDPTGLKSTTVDCNKINPVLGNMRDLCKIANGDSEDANTEVASAVLDAREEFFREIIKLSNMAGYYKDGYWYAALMLEYYLDGVGYAAINLDSNSSFTRDRGILRATKIKLPQSGDDALEITPLLHDFLGFVKENGICDGIIPYYEVKGKDMYVGGEPRPYAMGWWGAFGHVKIDVNYSNSYISRIGYGYRISTTASYKIKDNYRWGDKESTPLPLGWFILPYVDIPHEWEESLERDKRSVYYDFDVTWTERMNVVVSDTFNSFAVDDLYDRLGGQ
jgi:hypothetical protein